MAHSVSEAAARAVKNSQCQIEEKRTPEERLADIRKLRAAKLFVPPDDQDFLLAQFDQEHAAVMHLGPATASLLMRAEAAEEQVRLLQEKNTYLNAKIEEFRAVYEQENRSTSLTVEAVRPLAEDAHLDQGDYLEPTDENS